MEREYFALNYFEAGCLFEQTCNFLPVDIVVADILMIIILTDIVMNMAGDDMGQHFLQNLVIPRGSHADFFPSQTCITFGIILSVFHEICVTGIVAEAEIIGGELFFDLEQKFGSIGREPDIFDIDDDEL